MATQGGRVRSLVRVILAVVLACVPAFGGSASTGPSGATTAIGPGETRQSMHLALAMGLLQSGRVDQARRQLEAACASAPQTPAASMAVGQALLAMGEWSRAVAVLEKVQSVDETLTDLDFHLGVACLRVGRDADAVRLLGGKNIRTRAAREAARFYKGLALARLGRTGEARVQVARARSLSSTAPSTPSRDKMERIEETDLHGRGLSPSARPTDVNDLLDRPCPRRRARRIDRASCP